MKTRFGAKPFKIIELVKLSKVIQSGKLFKLTGFFTFRKLKDIILNKLTTQVFSSDTGCFAFYACFLSISKPAITKTLVGGVCSKNISSMLLSRARCSRSHSIHQDKVDDAAFSSAKLLTITDVSHIQAASASAR